MSQVVVVGSERPAAGVAATVVRIREALSLVGVEVATGSEAPPGALTVVVDPAAWYADAAEPADRLADTVGFSLAGSPERAADDARVGVHMAAVAHPTAAGAEQLRRAGCPAVHVALGCRPFRRDAPGSVSDPRRVAITSLGPPTARRLDALAHGAPWFDAVRCVHRFDGDVPADDRRPHAFARTRVVLDIAEADDLPGDPVLLLAVLEAGAVVATERPLDALPEEVARELVREPLEGLFERARDLAVAPERAAEAAERAHVALAAVQPLETMGAALAALVDAARTASRAVPPGAVRIDRGRPAPPSPSIVERLDDERQRPDAAVREAMRETLNRLRRLEGRLATIERGGAAQPPPAVLRAPSLPPAVSVSVLVPAFDAERFVLDALESVLATAEEPGAPTIEVIVVDDAPPQHDGAAVAAWAGEHTSLPVTVLRHADNRGLAETRNTALGVARGEFVLPLDADNALRPRGLRRLLDGIAEHPEAAFAYGILQEHDGVRPIGLRGLYPWEPDRLRYGNYIDALALIRRDALRSFGGYAADMLEPGYEDWDLWCRLATLGASGHWVPEIVASYRLRPTSMSQSLHLSHVGPLADIIERHPAIFG